MKSWLRPWFTATQIVTTVDPLKLTVPALTSSVRIYYSAIGKHFEQNHVSMQINFSSIWGCSTWNYMRQHWDNNPVKAKETIWNYHRKTKKCTQTSLIQHYYETISVLRRNDSSTLQSVKSTYSFAFVTILKPWC